MTHRHEKNEYGQLWLLALRHRGTVGYGRQRQGPTDRGKVDRGKRKAVVGAAGSSPLVEAKYKLRAKMKLARNLIIDRSKVGAAKVILGLEDQHGERQPDKPPYGCL